MQSTTPCHCQHSFAADLHHPLQKRRILRFKVWVRQRSANCLTRYQSTCDELMTAFYRGSAPLEASVRASEQLRRKPQRITATVPWHALQRLQNRADHDGRSLSNLVAHLLDGATN
jgi:hypothetical protein